MTTNSDPQLNDADLELLSAYIDRRLDDGERAALELRLNAEPGLRGALDELRATVALLHDLEPLKPPRSFAVAAPAAAPRRAWQFPWAALGSGLVAVVCLLAFSVVLLRGGGGGTPASAPVAGSAAAPTAAAAAEQQAKQVGVPCEVVKVEHGQPFEAIIETAGARGCDLIAMASHGRRGISALLLGSETMKVLMHSKVPVLVYR